MSVGVLIAGGRHFANYPALRANRMPDVVLLTADGRGPARRVGSHRDGDAPREMRKNAR
jgi:hypothetical protein